jgi:hypothetical protein
VHRTALRLSSFAVVLAVLFTGGWAVGRQFPTDDEPVPHEMDHGTHDGDAAPATVIAGR